MSYTLENCHRGKIETCNLLLLPSASSYPYQPSVFSITYCDYGDDIDIFDAAEIDHIDIDDDDDADDEDDDDDV